MDGKKQKASKLTSLHSWKKSWKLHPIRVPSQPGTNVELCELPQYVTDVITRKYIFTMHYGYGWGEVECSFVWANNVSSNRGILWEPIKLEPNFRLRYDYSWLQKQKLFMNKIIQFCTWTSFHIHPDFVRIVLTTVKKRLTKHTKNPVSYENIGLLYRMNLTVNKSNQNKIWSLELDDMQKRFLITKQEWQT